MSRNVLGLKQKHELTVYLKVHVDQLRDLTIDQIAEKATEECGFSVTGANVVYIRDIFELDIGRAKQPVVPLDQQQQIDELKASINGISVEVAVLKSQIQRLLIGNNMDKAPSPQLPIDITCSSAVNATA